MGSTGLSLLLRGALGGAGALVFLLGLAAIGTGDPVAGAWLLIAGAILILIALYEQTRYRAGDPRTPPGATAPPGPPWAPRPPAAAADGPAPSRYQRTDEVFDDPTTGQRLRVWFDPVTGDRRYVPEP